MLAKDGFSAWMGMQVVEVSEGKAIVRMTVRKEMLNGFGVAHGGITFSLADSALAFASNSHGPKSVSIDTSINHLKPVFEGDELVAIAQKESLSKSLGHYLVRVLRGEEVVALFKGVVFRKSEEWEV